MTESHDEPDTESLSITKRAILYARTATANAEAIIQQIEACWAWAQANGYTVIAQYSEIASGLALNLPRRDEAIAHATRQGAVLVVTDPSRLSRDFSELARLVQDCRQQGVTIYFVDKE